MVITKGQRGGSEMNAVIHTEGMSLTQKAILSGVIKGEREEDIEEKEK